MSDHILNAPEPLTQFCESGRCARLRRRCPPVALPYVVNHSAGDVAPLGEGGGAAPGSGRFGSGASCFGEKPNGRIACLKE